MSINLPIHNIRILDFNTIFTKYIEPNVLNDLHDYGLIKNDRINVKNKDVKKIMYHHIIYGLCDYVLRIRGKHRIVIYYCYRVIPGKDLVHYTDFNHVQTFLNKFVLKLIKMLPIKFMYEDVTFSVLRNSIKNDGSHAELINSANDIIENFDVSTYTFSKIRYFVKRYELHFLSNTFFQKLHNKQLILS